MLRQIKVRYDPLEDRMQLTLRADAQTHDLLLTRRIWQGARLALQRVLDRTAEAPVHLPPSVRASISAAHHQAVAAQTPAAHEPVDVQGAPAGALLVTGIRLGERKATWHGAQRTWVIQFGLHRHPEVRLVLKDSTLHALVEALLQREDVAQWSLPVLPVRSNPAAEAKGTLQ